MTLWERVFGEALYELHDYHKEQWHEDHRMTTDVTVRMTLWERWCLVKRCTSFITTHEY